jgi:hypothetical protein
MEYLKDMVTTLPPWNRSRSKDGKIFWDSLPGMATWVPENDPPRVGERVRILAWGEPTHHPYCGDVEGYQVCHGYLMIWVRPDVRPPWHVAQMPERFVCLFAGIELEWPVL